jgi:hypothetical protein
MSNSYTPGGATDFVFREDFKPTIEMPDKASLTREIRFYM